LDLDLLDNEELQDKEDAAMLRYEKIVEIENKVKNAEIEKKPKKKAKAKKVEK